MLNSKQLVLAITLLLIGFGCVTPKNQNIVAKQKTYSLSNNQQDPLVNVKQAAQSVFLLRDVQGRASGTGSLIGCEPVGKNQFRYFALTAHHVLSDLEKRMYSDDPAVVKDFRVELMFQPSFHGSPLRVAANTIFIEHSNDSLDWMIFSFVVDKLDDVKFVQLATEEEFKKLKSFEEIYGAGCGAGQGVQCRRGWMGATHNEGYKIIEQIVGAFYSWDAHPQSFFRPHVNIWYGDSGGAIFNKNGKQIGIINGITGLNSYGGGPVEHTAVCLKTYTIFKTVNKNSKFFKIKQ